MSPGLLKIIFFIKILPPRIIKKNTDKVEIKFTG